MEEITLVGKVDGVRVKVPVSGARLSLLIQAALSDDAAAEELTLNLTGHALTRVADYMQHHQHGEAALVKSPLHSRDLQDHGADPWDVQFIDHGDELELAEAAHYLDMTGLSHLCCAKIAARYWNRSPVQIAKMLNPSKPVAVLF